MAHPETRLAVPNSENIYYRAVGFDNDISAFRKIVMMSCVNTTEKGLILGILDDLNNPVLRDIYADWLEEHGRDDEAQSERKAAKVLRQPPPSFFGLSSGLVSGPMPFNISSGISSGFAITPNERRGMDR